MKLSLIMILAALAVASVVSAQDTNYPTRRLKKGRPTPMPTRSHPSPPDPRPRPTSNLEEIILRDNDLIGTIPSTASASFRLPKSRKIPSSSTSSKSEKKPRSSSSSKSRKTPRSYTSSKSRKSPSSRCITNERPRPVRSGQRFRFNLVQSNARCVDQDRELYEYGQFDNVKDFEACADVCVNDVQSSLINSGSFRGIDFDCRNSACRCLYDEGTLSNRNSGRFDRTKRNQDGYGSIESAKGGRSSRDIYCGKLVGAEALEADEFLEADVTKLWDM